MASHRIASLSRTTTETQIELTLNLDGTGQAALATGIPFFDHLLELFTRHGLFDLEIKAHGDVDVDYHHTVEDVGLVLGDAFRQALGDKIGIHRYGFFILPMDECLSRVAVDLSNRPYLAYDVSVEDGYVRDFNIILIKEFCRAFSNALGANVHVQLEYGEEAHHAVECVMKCLARALDRATSIDPRAADALPSTKGTLT
jgi:imidazoleglycerol-phosphate dehydratase